MPNLSDLFPANNPQLSNNESNLGPITLAFRQAIAKALNCIEIGLSGDIVRWRVTERDLTSFERIFYEAALRRPCFQALLPFAEGDEQ